MLERNILPSVIRGLSRQVAVVLLGPRQVGKTTLVLEVAKTQPSVYLDLESPSDRNKLSDPEFYLESHQDKLVILDEIHRFPELFEILQGLIDRGRQQGRKTGRFLLLGSASMELLRQAGESLAGRVSYIELPVLNPLETQPQDMSEEVLWVRGGFPESYLATDEEMSFSWRIDFLCTYLERDTPQFGSRISAETLLRCWTMLAHAQGGLFNASKLASGLGVKGQTVARYADLLVDLLLVRRLMPYHANTHKQLVKSPKLYIRDSGLVHALLSIRDKEGLLGHPIVGPSWEGFALGTLLNLWSGSEPPGFYRTAAGAEIDLILPMSLQERWAIEIKRGLSPSIGKGFHQAREDIRPANSFVVYSGTERFPLAPGIEAIGLREIAEALIEHSQRH